MNNSAVDFIKEKLLASNIFVEMFANGFEKTFEQAKEMEKQQIIDAFDEGQEYEYQYHINNTPKFDSQTYYNETFKK